MRETESESVGGGVRACGAEEGVGVVDYADAYGCVLGGRGGGLEWDELGECYGAEVIGVGLLTGGY